MPPLTPERWRALGPYLDEALDMPTEAQAVWLASLRAQDPSLADDLVTLLADHVRLDTSGFLAQAVPLPRHAGLASLRGQTVGAYRLVERIGQGGMGSVWLAERCDGRFEGRVAVKLLNLALMGRAGEERFRREGDILARLTHPHIAHLVDAGLSPSGHPYLVLEHVEGQRIDHYCDERALDIDARLHLFVDVLEAVAPAHANLIVPRDLKPANVLVRVDGQVKLLDFGIAKLLEGDAQTGTTRVAEMSSLTREGGSALTPEYAAPEQVMGGAVTTATDIYALGVLLYLLLSGQHPAGASVRSTAGLVRSIVDGEPKKMSDVVVSKSEAPETLEQIAGRRGTTPARLRRRLQGDLDTIVAKTLKKTASERYVSVTALADDLRRSLQHVPISARPDTLRYRAAKFIRRHTRGVAASGAVVLLVAGLTAFYTSRLATERDRARLEADKAAKVSDLLTRLLTSADPYATPDPRGEPTLRSVLDAGAERVQHELAGQPELQAEILTVIGRTYRKLGAYEKAQPLLERAIAIGRPVFGPESVRLAQSLHDLGTLLQEKGDYEGAARNLEQALDMRRKLLGREHADVAVTLVELARVYQDEGSNDRAQPLQREAVELRRKALGPEHRETAVSVSDLASVLRLKGELADAETLLRQCLELNLKALGPNHPNVFLPMHDLALITASRGDYASAEMQLRQALVVGRKTLGNQHPNVAVALNSLGRTLRDEGKYDEAAAALEEALSIGMALVGGVHPLVAIYKSNLATVYLARHDPVRAEPLLRDALEIRVRAHGVLPYRRRIFPEDDWSVGATKSLLGATLTSLSHYDEAEAMLLEARRDLEASDGPENRDAVATNGRLAALYDKWGRPDKAAAYRPRPSS